MRSIHLRPAEPDQDFGEIARLISSQEDDLTTESALREDYEAHQESLVRLMTAEDEQAQFLGFSWAYRNKVEPGRLSFYLVVKPERQHAGAGQRLYADLLQALASAHAAKLRTSVLDSSPESRAFLERRDFSAIRHQIGMQLDLEALDDRPWNAFLERLKAHGFRFTSMQELGNTEEAQRKLYALNDAASASTPGQGGEHAWASFEDFQQSVCGSDWYRPDGQIVAIDQATGDWAGMSAITQMPGCDYAYNLFTGVDLPYRGRKLGQAVKLLALRYARNVLEVQVVRTHHNTENLPMIAIDTKFGYRVISGAYLMEKILD
jgi:RimJ/RimL family protein N-acetyltransferase